MQDHLVGHRHKFSFRCTNGDFYVALGSSMGLKLLVWVGGGLLKRVLYFFGNEPRKISDPALIYANETQLNTSERIITFEHC